MKQCAFLSTDNLDDFECYDHLLFDPLKKRGWLVQEISWRNKKIDWNQFDVVVIRSPWDYQDDPKAFLDILQAINRSSARLENSLKTVEWNIDKTYLRDLDNNGIQIVPTLWKEYFNEDEFEMFFDALESKEIVIKPTISAGADNTFWISQTNQEKYTQQLSTIFNNHPFLVQPFMDNITDEGEFSLFFFGDTYSHTILKTPKTNDFRVQEEHGGSLTLIEKPEKKLIDSAHMLLKKLDPLPLYSRMDYVRTAKSSFALMELELIEPSLYFNMDPKSPKRFANVFDEWMKEKSRV